MASDSLSDGEFNSQDEQDNDMDASSNTLMAINGKNAEYLVDDMNNSHPDWLEAYVRYHCRQGKSDINEVEMVGINEDFFSLQWTSALGIKQNEIVRFPSPLNGRGDAKTQLTKLAEEGMQHLGAGEPGQFENKYTGQFIMAHPLWNVPIILAMTWITTFSIFNWLPGETFTFFTLLCATTLRDWLFFGQLDISAFDFIWWTTIIAWGLHVLEALIALKTCLQYRWMESVGTWVLMVFLVGFPQLRLLQEQARIVDQQQHRSSQHLQQQENKKSL
eukprot:m.81441 g.81441  ORF g.81441 m.81441 type:complete len:275 (+) comp25419_c0_seq3:120-944(+)